MNPLPAAAQHSARPMALTSPQSLLQWGSALLTELTCSSFACPLVRGGLEVSAGHAVGGGDKTLLLCRIITDVWHQKHQFRPYKDEAWDNHLKSRTFVKQLLSQDSRQAIWPGLGSLYQITFVSLLVQCPISDCRQCQLFQKKFSCRLLQFIPRESLVLYLWLVS